MINKTFRTLRTYTSITLLGFISLISLPIQAADFKPSSPIATLLPVILDNLDILELTAEQLDKVRDVSRKNFPQIEFINAQYHQLKSQLKEETLSVPGNITLSNALVEELGELDKKRMRHTVECVFALKEILTAEQYAELIATVNFNQ